MKKKNKLNILYEDKYLIVVNKDAHLLTIATAKEKEDTLYHQVSLYLKKQNKNNKVFIVHRLDKETSGLVLFAKSYQVKEILQNNWPNVKRLYMAVIHGIPKNKTGILKSFLKETKTNYVYSDKYGKEAITEYKIVKSNKEYSLVEIAIRTGRKHQIRVQFNDLGHPIVGERIYTNIKDKQKNLFLHASYLEFIHPITKELIKVESPIPKYFNELIK